MEERAKRIEEREISAIDGMLQSLYEKDLLTHIECRIIVCTRQLPEKQLAFFTIMMSKSQETAAQLSQLFWAMTHGLHAEEKLKLQESDHKSAINESVSTFLTNKNPMLNDAVIRCLFGFLPLDDIKNCRLVSRQWNSAAEVLLRKRAKIHFRTDGLRPETFFAVSEFSLPKPFSAFKFSEMNTNLSWPKSELEDFFGKWGKNIKELNLSHINIACANDDDPSELLLLYDCDVTPWFKNSSKITSLKIEGSEHDKEELNMSLSLGELKFLSKIKTFIMKGNSIELGSKQGIIRMAPVNIDLSNVTWKRDDEILTQFRYNDFFDFSQAATIRLNNCQRSNVFEVTFDIRNQAFNNTGLYLEEIAITNWEAATGSLQHVELRGISFPERNHLEITSLKISFSAIDLFAIPETVERVHVYNCNITCSGSLLLPNLKFLKLNWDQDYSAEFTQFRLEMCHNLKELAICHYGGQETNLTTMFAVTRLPANLQVLRIKGSLSKYLTDNSNFDIPALIVLEPQGWSRCTGFKDYTRIMKTFRAGTLVLVCYYYMEVNTDDIVKFLLTTMQKQQIRIFIGMQDDDGDIDDLHKQTPFEGSWISTIVDAKSNYYEFENVFGIKGRAITREEFINGSITVGDETVPFFLKED